MNEGRREGREVGRYIGREGGWEERKDRGDEGERDG